jgi:hypothetical protein
MYFFVLPVLHVLLVLLALLVLPVLLCTAFFEGVEMKFDVVLPTMRTASKVLLAG